MRALIWFGVIITVLVLQSTIIPLLAIKGIRPDMLLIVVVCSSLLLGKDHGVGAGFFSGLLQDLASGNIFGLNTLSKLATGYFFGMAERKVFKEHILLPVMAVAGATLFNNIWIVLLLFVFGYKVDSVPVIIGNALLAAIYNMLLSIPIHKAIYRISQSRWVTD